MSVFEELKRRNVVRVGIAYAVGAWVLLQIFDVIGEILVLPEWGGKLILALIVLGFFLALFFAWAFELTPEGIKREHEVDRSQSIAPQTGKKLNNAILVLMAVAIAYLLFDKFYLPQQLEMARPEQAQQAADQPAGPPAAAAEAQAAKPVDRQSIAVLPFDNRSRQEEDEFFVEGIHDDLLTSLARIGSLKVISRTSVTKYRNTEKSIPEIASELGVATVMEGAVQRSGNTVRINVQLIDAQTDEHLWAEIFDRELTADNLFAIQSEISSEIAKALKATLSPEEQQRISDRPTENLAAYNAYLRGRQLMVRRTSTDLDQAANEFQRAVELDPDFALAWVGVAETAVLRVTYSDFDVAEAVQLRQEATQRALELDDELGEAQLSRATMLNLQGRLDEADAAYRRAIELSPGYATAYMWYAGFLNDYPPRLQEAVELGLKAVELDPLSSIARSGLAGSYRILGRYGEAERQVQQLLELDPGFAPAYATKADILWDTGRFAEEAEWRRKGLELDPGRTQEMMSLGATYLELGYREAIAAVRERLADVDGQSDFLGFFDVMINLKDRNDAGARETLAWLSPRLQGIPDFQFFAVFVHAIAGDYAAARQTLMATAPDLLDDSSWPAFVERYKDNACVAGWVLRRTGDDALGARLLTSAAEYLGDTLPRYIEHADRYDVASCYAALGSYDRALDAFEARLADGHYAGWWLARRGPWFEPLWGDPRFEAAMQRAEAEMERQRKQVIQAETAQAVRPAGEQSAGRA